MDVLIGEDVEIVDVFELGPTEEPVITRLLGSLVRADGGVMRGANPKMEPVVYGTKLAWMPG